MLAAARDASAASDFPWPRAYEGVYQARRRECGFGLYASIGLAATSRGVATIAQAAQASRSSVIRDHLALPESRRVVCGISFGCSDEAHTADQFRTTRAPLQEVVTWLE